MKKLLVLVLFAAIFFAGCATSSNIYKYPINSKEHKQWEERQYKAQILRELKKLNKRK